MGFNLQLQLNFHLHARYELLPQISQDLCSARRCWWVLDGFLIGTSGWNFCCILWGHFKWVL